MLSFLRLSYAGLVEFCWACYVCLVNCSAVRPTKFLFKHMVDVSCALELPFM